MIDGWELNLLRFLSADESDLGCEDLFLRTNGDGIRWLVNCSDVFYWATADAEEINGQEDVERLRQCYADLEAAGNFAEVYAFTLWCARKLGMRPQQPWYRQMLKSCPEAAAIFDAAGPERAPGTEG